LVIYLKDVKVVVHDIPYQLNSNLWLIPFC
jgi:hypothetical protein